MIGFLSGLFQNAFSAPASWHQDELIKKSDAIAVIRIVDTAVSPMSASILSKDGSEVPAALILYASSVTEILYGHLPKNPLIVQFDGEGDRNPLQQGIYLLFLKVEGRFFIPMETIFKITEDKVFWYKKPFLVGDYGPEMGEVALNEAMHQVKELIKKYKK